MEKATIPGALAEALQKRREIMAVTVGPRAGQTGAASVVQAFRTSTETTPVAATTRRPL